MERFEQYRKSLNNLKSLIEEMIEISEKYESDFTLVLKSHLSSLNYSAPEMVDQRWIILSQAMGEEFGFFSIDESNPLCYDLQQCWRKYVTHSKNESKND